MPYYLYIERQCVSIQFSCQRIFDNCRQWQNNNYIPSLPPFFKERDVLSFSFEIEKDINECKTFLPYNVVNFSLYNFLRVMQHTSSPLKREDREGNINKI